MIPVRMFLVFDEYNAEPKYACLIDEALTKAVRFEEIVTKVLKEMKRPLPFTVNFQPHIDALCKATGAAERYQSLPKRFQKQFWNACIAQNFAQRSFGVFAPKTTSPTPAPIGGEPVQHAVHAPSAN